MNNSKFILGFLAILMILAVACSQSNTSAPAPAPAAPQAAAPASAAKTVAVSIQGFKFTPADITVKAGDTVVWKNEDSAPHTVESADGVFRSDELSKGDTFSFTFTSPGNHDYKCGIHPSMHGSVTVQ